MSTILQSYIHNPLLRNYFLSDQHNRAFCQVREKTGLCMACELDYVVAQVFSGNIGGMHSVFTPSQFLYRC
jgi:ubiquitin carboxyl-terminal hydrolase 22/27/51